MKSLFTCCILFFFLSAHSQTPERHFGIERKDNVVIIETNDSDSLAYDQLISLLAANQWSVEQQDRKNFLIRTTVRTIPALFSAETYLIIKKVSSKPLTIHITGYLKGNVGSQVISDEVSFKGAENAVYKKSFYKMQAIGKAYQNGNVYYGQVSQ